MRNSQNTLSQLNENNFDILNNGKMGMIKGGTYCTPTPPACGKSKKSKKSKKGSFCGTKPKSVKSLKSIKNQGGSCYPCGW